MAWSYVESYTGHERELTTAQREGNADAIKDFLLSVGWEIKPIAAYVGFVQYESGLNPAQWQWIVPYPFPPRDISGSYGLGIPQFTPWYEFADWIKAKVGSAYYDNTMCYSGQYQMDYYYETATHGGWYVSPDYPVTFAQYGKSSDKSFDWLVEAYNHCYGRGDMGDKALRISFAEHWYERWEDIPPTPPPKPYHPPKPLSKLLLYWRSMQK